MALVGHQGTKNRTREFSSCGGRRQNASVRKRHGHQGALMAKLPRLEPNDGFSEGVFGDSRCSRGRRDERINWPFCAERRGANASFSKGLPAPSSAQQVNRRSQFEQRIIRGIDSIDTRDWIEDNPFLFVRMIRDRSCQDDFPQMDERSFLGPMNRGIIHDVSIAGHLHVKLKADRSPFRSFRSAHQRDSSHPWSSR